MLEMKLENCFGTETVEFKSTLAELDKGIVSLTAMLNKSGTGTVYFGVRNDGEILGLDGTIGQETIRKIGTRIAESVRPAVVPKIYYKFSSERKKSVVSN